MLSDHYRHQITNELEKLLEQEGEEITSKVTILILLTIGMYIGPTRHLEVVPHNAEYDSEKKLHHRCTGADCGDKSETEAMAADDNNDDDNRDPRNRTR